MRGHPRRNSLSPSFHRCKSCPGGEHCFNGFVQWAQAPELAWAMTQRESKPSHRSQGSPAEGWNSRAELWHERLVVMNTICVPGRGAGHLPLRSRSCPWVLSQGLESHGSLVCPPGCRQGTPGAPIVGWRTALPSPPPAHSPHQAGAAARAA